ncbi:MBOAT family protein [Rossellomorea vietnamensis]|uniref:MBOAT family protein n=1 Tax=Rossellomorea vietnamensis TaxID=218284 RepID=A0A5D4KGJ5_9BACI|nr:MBOAT family O-acyltransferase [Rossellomorea vietnamensis]TYR75999.1 MBOAT family protein [Rossellomorea vietnamensis]
MIFNSFEFIFVFLPFVLIFYFFLNKVNFTLAKIWLLLSSIFFYSWWNPAYLPLILSSLAVNFFIGSFLGKEFSLKRKKILLTSGIVFNVSLLGFFKYYDFFIQNLNLVFNANFNLLHLLLPLAISFYTFQQIAYLVDSYRSETKEYNFLNYSLFVTFFPQLIAGPIVHHSQVMSQFQNALNRNPNGKNIAMGIFIFSIGLFKKVAIADTFSIWANNGFSSADSLTFFDGWITSLSYTFQLYFDFSGYSDMAIGAALLFNISLPMNFNSPYKALTIQDFWRRWHITLSHFLTRYIYIPLGGSRGTHLKTYTNIIIIFFISGIWHGAGWTFVVWGLLHGLASVISRAWNRAGFRLNQLAAWFLTFQFVNATWVLFRAPDFQTAVEVLKSMAGLHGIKVPEAVAGALQLKLDPSYIYTFSLAEETWKPIIFAMAALFISVWSKNSIQLTQSLKPNPAAAVYASILFIYSAFQLQKVSEFLYFNF